MSITDPWKERGKPIFLSCSLQASSTQYLWLHYRNPTASQLSIFACIFFSFMLFRYLHIDNHGFSKVKNISRQKKLRKLQNNSRLSDKIHTQLQETSDSHHFSMPHESSHLQSYSASSFHRLLVLDYWLLENLVNFLNPRHVGLIFHQERKLVDLSNISGNKCRN